MFLHSIYILHLCGSAGGTVFTNCWLDKDLQCYIHKGCLIIDILYVEMGNFYKCDFMQFVKFCLKNIAKHTIGMISYLSLAVLVYRMSVQCAFVCIVCITWSL